MVPSHDRGENQVVLRVSGMSMGKEMLMPRDKLVDALPSDQADGKRGRLLALKREPASRNNLATPQATNPQEAVRSTSVMAQEHLKSSPLSWYKQST